MTTLKIIKYRGKTEFMTMEKYLKLIEQQIPFEVIGEKEI